ncbi:MAG TPA: hypothetical protein VGK58_22500 [Lacipirellulaceae bacterium]
MLSAADLIDQAISPPLGPLEREQKIHVIHGRAIFMALAPAVFGPAASFAAIYADSAPPAAAVDAEYRHSCAVHSADDLDDDTALNLFRNLAPDDDYRINTPTNFIE